MKCAYCEKEITENQSFAHIVNPAYNTAWYLHWTNCVIEYTKNLPIEDAAQHHAHLTPESLATSQAVINTSALEQSDGNTPPAQAQVA